MGRSNTSSRTALRSGPASALVTPFSPTNGAALASFLSAYGLTNGQVRLFGPWLDSLDNVGGRVALERPQAADLPDQPDTSWVIVDEAIYFHRNPWPAGADGTGAALERLSCVQAGNDPRNWRAASPPTPGGAPAGADINGNGIPDAWERRCFSDVGGPDAEAGDDRDGDGAANGAEYVAGTDPTNAASRFALDIGWSGGRPVISFFGIAAEGSDYSGLDRLYGLESCTSLLTGQWQAVSNLTAVPGANLWLRWTNAATAGPPQDFRGRVGLQAK
jgi:hypothetical protein